MKKEYKDYRNFAHPSIQTADPPEKSVQESAYTVHRTINGIPVSANDFPERCSVEDSDALRILLTARQRANSETVSEIPGENQVIH